MFEPNFAAVKSHLNLLNKHVAGACPCHVHGKEVIPDLYEILRLAQMRQTSDDLGKFLVEVIEVLRYYRGRVHRADEDDEGTFSKMHTVYGVHRDAMTKADEIYNRAKAWGLLVEKREYL